METLKEIFQNRKHREEIKKLISNLLEPANIL